MRGKNEWTYMHVGEASVDFIEFTLVCDIFVDLDLALEIIYSASE